MTYKETLEYLFEKTPMFQERGAVAYKAGLDVTLKLSEHYKNPHKHYKTIHVAGTNGKGSVSHTIAAILSSAGYKVGLFTSPHLLDFSERIRVDGKTISQDYVLGFVSEAQGIIEELKPSFFELTTMMAFCYFRDMRVDIAVVETGMGGKEDSTNIITPVLSVITNISFDHTQFLGDTIAKIAYHKSGIIKDRIPVVIGRKDAETDIIFVEEAEMRNSDLAFAPDMIEFSSVEHDIKNNLIIYETPYFGRIEGQLTGIVQKENTKTILAAVLVLRKHLDIPSHAVVSGFRNVVGLTGLRGRFETISKKPLVLCDTAHNMDGIQNVVKQLGSIVYDRLHFVFGMVSDKDISSVLRILPKDAIYYFTRAKNKRALPLKELSRLALDHNLIGDTFDNVADAYNAAKINATSSDCIFVGGSNFIVADFLHFVSSTHKDAH